MYQECDEQFVGLIASYPYLLENTIVKSYYLKPRAKMLFEILVEEYKKNKSLIIDRLIKYENFDLEYFVELYTCMSIYETSNQIKFKEYEKVIIERYKQEKYHELIVKYDGDCEKLYSELTKINDINYNENDYLTSNEMIDVLSKQNTKIELGYPYLDYSLNLSQNDLLIIGAGTGTGKTAFGLNLLVKLSKKYQCIYFNMEMSKSIIYRRILAIMSGIEMNKLSKIHDLSDEEKRKVVALINEIELRKIILVNKVLSIKEIKKDVINTNDKRHKIVFLDHIGLIKSNGKSRYEIMTEIAKELRELSINCECTIIGLCQMNREAQKNDETPKLQDLRDSGEIEQSARKVLLLHNITQNKESRIQDVEVIIAKNDDGNKLIKLFRFDKYTQNFSEYYNEPVRNRGKNYV